MRRHYIREWAEKRELRPVDIANELHVEISQVIRWIAGQMPRRDMQLELAKLFGQEEYEEPDEGLIFRDPEVDWLYRLLRNRTAEEIAHIRRSIETTFPPKTGTNN